MERIGHAVTVSHGSTCQYILNAPIDRGSYGTVFEARIVDHGDFAGEDIVAVKCVPVFREVSRNAEKSAKLQKNLKNLLDIEHPHLVKYYKACLISHAGRLSEYRLVMDYYADGDLARLLNQLKAKHLLLKENDIIGYAAQLADGLAFLHGKNVIHGDLKPANVLMKQFQNGQYLLRIGDFDDSVRMRTNVTTTRDISNIRGTYRYMSPEMLRKYYACLTEESVGRKTDVWSLGCVVLDLINIGYTHYLFNESSGEKLEAGNGKVSDARFADLVVHGWVPHIPDKTSKFLTEHIRKCLCVDSVIRISAVDLLFFLRNARDSVPTKAVKYLSGNGGLSATDLAKTMTNGSEKRESNCPGDGILLFYFEFYKGKTMVQWLDSSFTLHYLALPEYLKDRKFLPLVLSTDNEVILHLTDDSNSLTEIIGWEIGGTSLRTIWRTQPIWKSSFAFAFKFTSAVVVESEIYYGSGGITSFFHPTFATKLRKMNIVDGTLTKLPRPGFFKRVDSGYSAEGLFRYGSEIICCMTGFGGIGCFDTETNKWHYLTNISDLRQHYASVLLDKCIYILGGANITGEEVLSSCYRYSLKERVWERIADLSAPRAFSGVFVLNGLIFVYGGSSRAKLTASPGRLVRTMERYDPKRNQWLEVHYTDTVGSNSELSQLENPFRSPQPICILLDQNLSDGY